MRKKLNFQDYEVGGTVYLRMLGDEPNFLLLHSTSKQTLKVQQLRLHIDFMHAELYPNEVGSQARGLGVVEFGSGGPRLVDRSPHLMDTSSYGFVFDMASPYPLSGLTGLKPHPVGSTLTPVRRAIAQAYDLYTAAIEGDPVLGGVPMPRDPSYRVPVFEVSEWRRGRNQVGVFGQSGNATYQPIFKLVGFVSHIGEPLSDEEAERWLEQEREVGEPVYGTDPAYGGLSDETGGTVGIGKDPIPPRRYRARPRLNMEQ